MDVLVIIVKPVRASTKFEAWLGDELLCTKAEPFLAAARVLQDRGVPDDTPIVMKHHGNAMVCMRASVGKVAGLTVSEGDRRPRFTKFEPYGRETAEGTP